MAATPASARVEDYGPRPGLLVPQPAPERGVACVLSASPDGKFLAYGNGTSVIIRSIEDPHLAFAYGEHTAQVKVAKFSPTGKYIASGDVSGKVRIWAFTTVDHTLKFEFQALGGEIEDLAWDAEAKRILAVGGGSTRAKVFMWDTGSNLAEIVPHSKKNLTGDIKPTRPFKLAMGGEDFNMSFYGGPPFKYEKGLKEHSNFVNCVRYAPDGSRFASVSSDKSGVIYDGTSGDVIGKLDATAGACHSGSILSCAWSPDSKSLVTASADKTVRVWDVSGAGPSFPCTATYAIGKGAVDDMQHAVVWPRPDLAISVSLDGTLNYLSVGAGADGKVVRRVTGHKDPMNTIDFDPVTGKFFTGDMGGRVVSWTPLDEGHAIHNATVASGEVATKKVAGVATAGGEVVVVAWDDKLRIGDAVSGELKHAVPLGAQPKGIAVSPKNPSVRVVVTSSAVLSFKGPTQVAKIDAAWGPTCVDISQDGTLAAIGGNDKKIHIFKLAASGELTPDGDTKELGAPISVIGISPDGSQVAAGDSLREVRLYSTGPAKEAIIASKWMNHTTRVTGLKWAPNGQHIATVSTDRRIVIWDPKSEAPKKVFDLAHPQPFAACIWTDSNTLWTLGTDGVVVRRVLAL